MKTISSNKAKADYGKVLERKARIPMLNWRQLAIAKGAPVATIYNTIHAIRHGEPVTEMALGILARVLGCRVEDLFQ